MSIDVDVVIVDNDTDLIKPIKVYGAGHGEVYQQYMNEQPQQSFLVGTGVNDRPIMVWWEDEEQIWRISSQTKTELCEYNKTVKYKHLPDAHVQFSLTNN